MLRISPTPAHKISLKQSEFDHRKKAQGCSRSNAYPIILTKHFMRNKSHQRTLYALAFFRRHIQISTNAYIEYSHLNQATQLSYHTSVKNTRT